MAIDKPTVRASEALAGAQTLAETRGNQLVEPEHLLLSLLDQPEGVVQPIVERAGADPRALRAGAQAAVEARPSVSGANVTVEFAPAFRAVVRRAGEEAAHLFQLADAALLRAQVIADFLDQGMSHAGDLKDRAGAFRRTRR